MDFNEKLQQNAEKINISIKEDKVIKFKKYMDLLLKWNKKINLTSITDEDDIILKHFIDSLTIEKYVDPKQSVIDIGTGAGFPGIPLKIMNDNVEVTLMDSLNKRINFLNEVIKKLDLKNITTIHSRAEDLAKDNHYRERYDVAESRAVANLSTLSEYMLPFVKVGGKCICMKGSNIDEERKIAEKAINMLGGKIVNIENFKLANTDNERNIIIIEKIRKTDSKYPRKAGIPSKEPLK